MMMRLMRLMRLKVRHNWTCVHAYVHVCACAAVPSGLHFSHDSCCCRCRPVFSTAVERFAERPTGECRDDGEGGERAVRWRWACKERHTHTHTRTHALIHTHTHAHTHTHTHARALSGGEAVVADDAKQARGLGGICGVEAQHPTQHLHHPLLCCMRIAV